MQTALRSILSSIISILKLFKSKISPLPPSSYTHIYIWAGLYAIWQRSGILSWATLVSPAALLAVEWVINNEVSHLLLQIQSQLHSGLYPDLAALYLRKDGSLKKVGDTVQQPALSRTLYNIAQSGPDYLYVTMAATLSSGIRMRIAKSWTGILQSETAVLW